MGEGVCVWLGVLGAYEGANQVGLSEQKGAGRFVARACVNLPPVHVFILGWLARARHAFCLPAHNLFPCSK